jgi:predicted metalloendopeptidase
MSAKLAGFFVVLAAAATPGQPPTSGIDLSLLDATVRPQDDLFRAASGKWLERTVIPADRVTHGTFTELADKTESDLRTIIEGVAATRDKQRGSARQIADLYASAMDQRRTDERGLRPIEPLLHQIDAIETLGDLAHQNETRRVASR